MNRCAWKRLGRTAAGAGLLMVLATHPLAAQQVASAVPQPSSPKAAAPIDLAGYWVSIVDEDWRWRMVTPPKGDLASVPLNPRGEEAANSWDPATDGSCLAYGAAALMRMPTRLHIVWEGEKALKLDTDAGRQTRRFTFDSAAQPEAEHSLQGFSRAEWQFVASAGRGQAAGVSQTQRSPSGSLKVVTTNLSAAWLRKNGVPYSADATVTEYYDRFAAPNADEWMVVTTIVHDPTYLQTDFITSTHFRKEPTGKKWDPAPCRPAP